MAESRFRRGDLRLLLLAALEAGPRHGYDLMRELEDRYAGLYRPSAGSVYPRLNSLVDAGLVTRDGRDYKLTRAGQAEIDARRDELAELAERVVRPRREASRALRAEVRAAAQEVRAQQRSVNRERRERHHQRSTSLASLRVELRVFQADVLAAARRAEDDPAAIARVVRTLDDSRAAVLAALADH